MKINFSVRSSVSFRGTARRFDYNRYLQYDVRVYFMYLNNCNLWWAAVGTWLVSRAAVMVSLVRSTPDDLQGIFCSTRPCGPNGPTSLVALWTVRCDMDLNTQSKNARCYINIMISHSSGPKDRQSPETRDVVEKTINGFNHNYCMSIYFIVVQCGKKKTLNENILLFRSSDITTSDCVFLPHAADRNNTVCKFIVQMMYTIKFFIVLWRALIKMLWCVLWTETKSDVILWFDCYVRRERRRIGVLGTHYILLLRWGVIE